MKTIHHTAIGALIAVPTSMVSPSGALSFLAATILADMDHLFFYVFHERKLPPTAFARAKVYRQWQYFGPRIHVFHNYEMLSVLAFTAWVFGGTWFYIFAGMMVHALLDQIETKYQFGFLRIRSLIGDIIRYLEYLRICRRGGEEQYMIHRRDSWKNHLKKAVPKHRLHQAEAACEILRLYPDVPHDVHADSRQWMRLF